MNAAAVEFLDREDLRAELSSALQRGERGIARVNGNVTEVEIDFETGAATVFDVLDADSAVRVSVQELIEYLR